MSNGINLDDVYRPAAEAKQSIGVGVGKVLMGRLGLSILGSIVVGTFMNLPYLKTFVRWTCHIILVVLGRPEMPEQHKIDNIVAKAKEAVEKVHRPNDGPSFKEKVAEKIKETVASEAAAPVKQVAEKARTTVKVAQEKVTEKVTEVKDTAKTEAKKVVDKLDNLRASNAPSPGMTPATAANLPRQLPGMPPPPKYGPSPRQRARKAAGIARAQRDMAVLNAEIAAGTSKAIAEDAAARARQAQAMDATVNSIMRGGR
jgi:hypothetical protein